MKTKLYNYIPTLAFTMLSAFAASAVNAEDILYDQAFTNTSGSEQNITYINGWNSYYAGTGNEQYTNVRLRSDSNGYIWVNPTSTGFVIEGTDISVALSEVSTISIDTIQTKTAASFQLLIHIDDGSWYISTTSFTPKTASSWATAISEGIDYNEVLAFSTDSSAWMTFEMSSSGITTTALTEDLSGTTITGIGWYVTSTESYNYSRFDNLEVTSIPEASTSVFVVAGMLIAFLGNRFFKRR